MIKDLVLQAQLSLGISTAPAQPIAEPLPADVRDAPLLFVPSLLTWQFERDGIRTVGQMLLLHRRELEGAAGWGEKKIVVLTALQNLSMRLYLGDAIDPATLLGSIVDSCLLHDPRIGDAPISEFVTGILSKTLSLGAAQTDTEALRRLIASFASTGSRTNAYFGDTAMAQMEWRDIPLQLNTRAESFLDRFNLQTIGELDRVATTGLVRDVSSGEFVSAAEQENFGDGSLEKLRAELEKLAQRGLRQYRSGTICFLEELPRADMRWRDVPLEVPPRIETFLDEVGLTKIGDVYRFAVRVQVKCQQSGNWISAIDMKSVTERAIADLRRELMALAAKGLDRYRYGDAGKPATASELIAQLRNFINEREVDVLRLRTSGLTLEETAVQIGITRERVRQIESGAWAKCNRFRDAAHEIFLPISHAMEQLGTIDLREALTAIGASERSAIFIVGQIAGIDSYLLDDHTLTKYSRRQLEGLELLLRETLESSSLHLSSTGFSVRTLISHCSDRNKWFVQEWDLATFQRDLVIPKENMVRLIGVDWLRPHIQSQLVVAGINGLFFQDIRTALVISSVEELESLMGDTVRRFGDERFRSAGGDIRQSGRGRRNT